MHFKIFAHKCNLTYIILLEPSIFQNIEGLLKKIHAHILHLPKRHLEFVKLVEIMETKGLKLLKNIQTHYVLFLEPLKQLLAQCRVVLPKMVKDYNDNKETQVICLIIICCMFA